MKLLYEELADLLEYPDDKWGAKADRCKPYVSEITEIASLLKSFLEQVEGKCLAMLQERYTQTFDLNPVCTLEVGYHLFGENYKRGLFLANLRETESPYELGQDNQLPDYLPVLLRLLVRLEDEELRADLIGECLIPSVELIISALKKADSVYLNLLEVVLVMLKSELPFGKAAGAAVEWRRHAQLPVLQPGRF